MSHRGRERRTPRWAPRHEAGEATSRMPLLSGGLPALPARRRQQPSRGSAPLVVRHSALIGGGWRFPFIAVAISGHYQTHSDHEIRWRSNNSTLRRAVNRSSWESGGSLWTFPRGAAIEECRWGEVEARNWAFGVCHGSLANPCLRQVPPEHGLASNPWHTQGVRACGVLPPGGTSRIRLLDGAGRRSGRSGCDPLLTSGRRRLRRQTLYGHPRPPSRQT